MPAGACSGPSPGILCKQRAEAPRIACCSRQVIMLQPCASKLHCLVHLSHAPAVVLVPYPAPRDPPALHSHITLKGAPVQALPGHRPFGRVPKRRHAIMCCHMRCTFSETASRPLPRAAQQHPPSCGSRQEAGKVLGRPVLPMHSSLAVLASKVNGQPLPSGAEQHPPPPTCYCMGTLAGPRLRASTCTPFPQRQPDGG